MTRRIIVYDEKGKKVYEGPEQRRNESGPGSMQLLGFPLRDWVALAALVIYLTTSTGFFLSIRDAVEEAGLSKKFRENSDTYHGLVHGVPFKMGQPMDPQYDLKPIRRMIEDTVNGSNSKGG